MNTPDMGGAAETGCTVSSVVRICLEPGDQLLHVLGWQVLLPNEHQRVRCEKSYGIEILQEVIADAECRSAEDVGVQLPDAQRVAVGRGAGDARDTNAASRPRDILDDQRLTERGPHAVGKDARDQIRRSARREWDDHRDRMGWKGLCPCEARHGRKCGGSRAEMQKGSSRKLHPILPNSCSANTDIIPLGVDPSYACIEIHITGDMAQWS